MPPRSAAPVFTQRALSISFQDFTGKPRSSRVVLSSAATDVQIDALELATGNLSNARAMDVTVSSETRQQNPANALNTAYDEAHATVEIVLVFVFQNDVGEVQMVEIPAPDASLFNSDGSTPNDTNALIIAYKAAALAAMNEGSGTYAYARGFRSTRSARANRARIPHQLVEPGGASQPPIAPGA